MAFGIHLGWWVLSGWRVLVPVLLPSSPSATQQPAPGHTGQHSTPPQHPFPPQHPVGSQSTQHPLLGAMEAGNWDATASPALPGSFLVMVPRTRVASKL